MRQQASSLAENFLRLARRFALAGACMLLATCPLGAQDFMMGFAPEDLIVQVARPRSFLGVGIAEINENRSRELKLGEPRGVEITRVEKDSPAEKAGLQVGDVVLSYGGQRVVGIEQFGRLVRETPPGRKVNMEVFRGGKTLTMEATLEERRPVAVSKQWEETMRKQRESLERLQESMKPLRDIMPLAPDVPRAIMAWGSGVLGLEVESLQGQFAEFFGVKEGVLIRSVRPDSPAAKAGLRAGDVVTKVDGRTVTTPHEITQILRAKTGTFTVPMQIVRNRQEMSVSVEVDRSATERGRRVSPVRTIRQ